MRSIVIARFLPLNTYKSSVLLRLGAALSLIADKRIISKNSRGFDTPLQFLENFKTVIGYGVGVLARVLRTPWQIVFLHKFYLNSTNIEISVIL